MNFECPQCKAPVPHEGQKFCNRCGADLRAFYASQDIPLTDTSPEGELSGDHTLTMDVEPLSASSLSPFEQTVTAGNDITLDTAAPDADVTKKAILRIVLPSSDVFDRELKKVETQIGKSPRNDIVIADPAVSSSHAVIRFENGAYTITDLGSRNGTSINGKRITEPYNLQHGDVIGLGVTRLTFRMSGHSETSVINIADVTAGTASSAPMPVTEDSLAAALISQGFMQGGDVERLRGAAAKGRRLVRAIIDEKAVDEEKLRDLMSRIFQIQTINLREAKIDEALAAKFSAKLARQFHIFPVAETPWVLTLAVDDPTNAAALEETKQKTNLQLEVRLATFSEINEQIDKFYAPKLVGVLPDGRTLEYPITRSEVEIGKAPHNHIILSDQTVSNTHAVLMSRDGGYNIVDLGSRNGTFVNGERLTTQAKPLSHGDKIQMGKTVLTFRNPAETPENITAILSPEALEEVRSRAGIVGNAVAQGNQTIAPAEVATLPVSGNEVQPSPQAVAGPTEAEESDEEKKKKKKKKKGKDERLKAAYIGAVGRILAAIFSVVLTVVLALYINNSMRSGGSPVLETSHKGKAKVKVAKMGAGTPFDGAVYEASGVVQIPNSPGVYFVDDGKPGQIFYMPINADGKQAGPIKPIDIGAAVADPESITYSGSFFYVASSLSHPDLGDRNAIARFTLDPATQTIQGKTEVLTGIRQFLIDNVPEIKAVADTSSSAGGLNIEGLAWDAINERLLIGLRSPVANGKAMIVPIKLKDPRGAFSIQNLTMPEPPIQMALGGLGIRDIQFDPQTGVYLIIAGSPVHHEHSDFVLYEWNGDTSMSKPESAPREISKLDAGMKPEGVTRARVGGKDFIFIVGDGSRYMKLDLEEQDATR